MHAERLASALAKHRPGGSDLLLELLGVDRLQIASDVPEPHKEKIVRWEYLTLEQADTDRLNALGAEGWELVAVVSPGHFVLHYFFKRQKTG